MGTEASKPVAPPEEWIREGNQFQIISPVSDISNPSDIHRIHRHRLQTANQKNRDHRRVSKTVTKSMPLNSQNQMKQVPPPSAFYFPTKETERRLEKSKRASNEHAASDKENAEPKGLKKLAKAMTGCFTDNHETNARLQRIEEENDEERRQAVRSSKTKKASKSTQRRVSEFDAMLPKEQRRLSSESRQSTKSKKSQQSGIQQILSAAEPTFVIREAEGMVDPEEYSSAGSANLGITGVGALHQEDAYFARLTTEEPSRYSEFHDSPLVHANKALNNLPSALGDNADSSVAESPISNLFVKPAEEAAAKLEANDRKDIRKSASSSSAKSGIEEASSNGASVNNLIRFSTQLAQIGELATAPDVHAGEEEGEEDSVVDIYLDETYDSFDHQQMGSGLANKIKSGKDVSFNSHRVSALTMGTFDSIDESEAYESKAADEDSTKSNEENAAKGGQLIALAEENDDEDSAILSYFRPEEKNTASAFRTQSQLPEEPIKQIATLGPSKKSSRTSKISKLESLFDLFCPRSQLTMHKPPQAMIHMRSKLLSRPPVSSSRKITGRWHWLALDLQQAQPLLLNPTNLLFTVLP